MEQKKNGALPVLALIFAFIFPLVGVILSIVSLAKKCGKKGLSITALIISVIWMSILSVLIVLTGSVIGLTDMVVKDVVTSEQNESNNVKGKKLTNYYYDSPIVSARYFHREEDGLVYEDIPEDQIEDLVKIMDSLDIVKTSGWHTDYFYGMQKGVECTLEDGTYFVFDGERLEYFRASGNSYRRFLYFDRPFEEAMDDFFALHPLEQ